MERLPGAARRGALCASQTPAPHPRDPPSHLSLPMSPIDAK